MSLYAVIYIYTVDDCSHLHLSLGCQKRQLDMPSLRCVGFSQWKHCMAGLMVVKQRLSEDDEEPPLLVDMDLGESVCRLDTAPPPPPLTGLVVCGYRGAAARPGSSP